MMKNLLTIVMVAVVAITINAVLCNSAQAVEITWPEPTWPEIFEPNQLLTLYLEMDPADWQYILHSHPGEGGPKPDCIYDPCEVLAWFWMQGEQDLKIRVAVRRKKGFAFPDETNPEKVALKIDINQYYPEDPNAATEWHGQKKLSLEVNIDSIDVISEGVACNIHRMASATEGYGWPVWYANWCKLYVNGAYKGVYAFVEQYDKQYMQHRGLYVGHGCSWLYKDSDCYYDGYGFEFKIGDDTIPRSQAVEALCYAPFVQNALGDPTLMPSGGVCSVPDDANVIADLNQWIDMQRILSTAAIDAFLANADPLFWKGSNTYFFDPNINVAGQAGRKRMYLPWDVDGCFKSDTTAYYTTLYYVGSSETYDDLILTKPVFRSQYNQIMRDLLDGPLTFADINDFLDRVEPVISSAVAADPWAMAHLATRGYSSPAACFDGLRDWFKQRIPNVRQQVAWDEPQLPPGIVLLNDAFSGSPWNANWTGSWVSDSTIYAHATPSAKAKNGNEGVFTSKDLDASNATAIHVEFWFQKDDIEATEFTLYYYNGTSYNLVRELDTLGEDDIWLYYTDTITDSNYFKTNFKIRFDGFDLDSQENVWVDEVVITKEVPQLTAIISGTILDPNAAPVAGVSVNANNAGGSDITDVNGYYELEITSGWSGTVTPTKTDYTFSPTSRSYTNVTTDQTNQGYTATSIYDLYPDGVIDWLDLDVLCDNWLTAGPGDFNSDGDVDLVDYAKFASAW